MSVTAVALSVIAGALVLLGVFIIPTIIEIRKTLSALRSLISNTDVELKPVLKELQDTLAELKIITEGVATKVDDVKIFMDAVGDTGRNIRTINAAIGSVAHAAATSSAWLTGVKVAGKVLSERIIKKRG